MPTVIEGTNRNVHDQVYLRAAKDILDHGSVRKNRTGADAISVFGMQLRYPFTCGFPLLTSKRIYWKGVVGELMWFLRGETNISQLEEQGIYIWSEWADSDGELGPVYGKQWRDFNGVDQIDWVVDEIMRNPMSRRLVVSAWNPEVLPDESFSPNENASNGKQALPPCHTMFQFYVDSMNRLWCQLYQRSADWFIGVPFNVASYSLLTAMIAHKCGLTPGGFVHTIGDAHIYLNHVDQFEEQFGRDPIGSPGLAVKGRRMAELTDQKIELINYKPHPSIVAEVAI